MIADEMLTVGEAARRAGVDPSTIRRWTKTGALRAVRTPGGDRRIRAADLAEALSDDTVDLSEASPPECLVPHWASVTAAWGGWRPPERLDSDTLVRLRLAADMVRSDMESVIAAIRSELDRR